MKLKIMSKRTGKHEYESICEELNNFSEETQKEIIEDPMIEEYENIELRFHQGFLKIYTTIDEKLKKEQINEVYDLANRLVELYGQEATIMVPPDYCLTLGETIGVTSSEFQYDSINCMFTNDRLKRYRVLIDITERDLSEYDSRKSRTGGCYSYGYGNLVKILY